MAIRYLELVAEVVRSYRPEKRDEERRLDLLSVLVFRPLSFLVTPVFLLAGWSADAVTGLGFGIAVAMPTIAMAQGPEAAPWISALVFGNLVLDCVDGNVARVTRRSSRIGGMLDGQASLLFWAGFFAAVGAMAEDGSGGSLALHGREIGLVLAVLFLAQRSLEDKLEDCVGVRVRWEPPAGGSVGEGAPGAAPSAPPGGQAAVARVTLASLGRPVEQALAIAGPLAAGRYGVLPWFLAGVATYQLSLLALWLPRYASELRRQSVAGSGGA